MKCMDVSHDLDFLGAEIIFHGCLWLHPHLSRQVPGHYQLFCETRWLHIGA